MLTEASAFTSFGFSAPSSLSSRTILPFSSALKLGAVIFAFASLRNVIVSLFLFGECRKSALSGSNLVVNVSLIGHEVFLSASSLPVKVSLPSVYANVPAFSPFFVTALSEASSSVNASFSPARWQFFRSSVTTREWMWSSSLLASSLSGSAQTFGVTVTVQSTLWFSASSLPSFSTLTSAFASACAKSG